MMPWLRREVFCPWLSARHGSDYKPHLAALRREIEEAGDPDRRREMQVTSTRAILEYAHARSPFYREHFDAAGFHPDQFHDLDDLARVPVFEKEHIIGRQEEILATGVPEADRIPTATGTARTNREVTRHIVAEARSGGRRHVLSVCRFGLVVHVRCEAVGPDDVRRMGGEPEKDPFRLR